MKKTALTIYNESMCYNIALAATRQDLVKRFGTAPEEWEARFFSSGFEFPVHPVLQASRQFVLARWGLIPAWARQSPDGGLGLRGKTLNARSEDMWNKPSYRQAARDHRILIPVTGFFEWTEKNGRKQPLFIDFPDQPVFALAGLAEFWEPEPGAGLAVTFSLVTGAPGPVMAPLHERSPVLVDAAREQDWLSGSESEVRDLCLPRPWPGARVREIGPLIGQRGADRNRPEILLPPGPAAPAKAIGQPSLFDDL